MFGFIKKVFSGLAGGRKSSRHDAALDQLSETGHAIGRYQVLGELGRGGMGIVLLAQDPFIDRFVAIKTTTAPIPADPVEFRKFTTQFFHEARAVGNLNHPNIVGVYDALLEGDRCYLIMEYVDGASLSQHLKPDKQPNINTIVKVGYRCAQALEYAHQAGIIHRDIKPANIMISKKSEVKLSDFGIASIEGRSSGRDDSVTASVNYASPEQLRNEPLTPKSDLFSLGVVLYEMLTGRKPFFADNEMASIYKILNEDPEPIKKYRPDCPDSLVRIVERLLDKTPDQRHRTDTQLLSDLSASFGHLRFMEEEIHFEEKFNAIKKLSFFQEFSTSELVEILKSAQWIQYEPGAGIFKEGAQANEFYIIVAGKVYLKKRGRKLADLGVGDVFGEMGGRSQTPQVAAAQAQTKAVVLKIGLDYLKHAAPSTQVRFYKGFNAVLNRRFASACTLYIKGM